MKAMSPFLQALEVPASLPALSKYIPELSLVEQKLAAELGRGMGPVKDIAKHLLNSGGKRIRPLLACISGRLFEAKPDDVITCAASLELIHMASLVHDDIIDQSDTRRGHPSVNARWGNQVAVLTGDFLFARAFHLLSREHLLPVLEQVVDTISAMCEGEIQQSVARGKAAETEELYLERIHKKTGKLIAVSCSIGALLENRDPVKLISLQTYGVYLGYAFQIIDDVLDYGGDSLTLGKPVGADLQQGHITLPLIKLMKDTYYRTKVKAMLETQPLTAKDAQEIAKALTESGAIDAARQEAREFIKLAKQQLEVFEPSWAVSALSILADFVLERIR